ncbi:uncharacterized protein LOC131931054 [Physella acuta]|uniref:uncharacterized protein LOC131931054 n=1 Tax=Physella acuta TaxID=109671 RepID=UPI0027DE3E96|nr:uncharacterized protein LOC131931054 [Physella acuta]
MASMFSIFLVSITNMCLVSGVLFNAALYKPAFMSSVNRDWNAECANDGNANVYVYSGSCAHSILDNPGWWMVDLRGQYKIEQIVLVNRGDDPAGANRTKNFTFDVFKDDPRLSGDFPMKLGQVCYTRIEPVGRAETFTQSCTAPIVGRFVRFVRYSLDMLNFCEIKVMTSTVLFLENNFSVKSNFRLQITPLSTTYTGDPSLCILLCLQRRDSDTCTAVNWIRTTKQCQMLKVNPRNVTSYVDDPNSDVYVEM